MAKHVDYYVSLNSPWAFLGSRRFEAMADGAAFPIDIVHHSELARMRALLLGVLRYIDA